MRLHVADRAEGDAVSSPAGRRGPVVEHVVVVEHGRKVPDSTREALRDALSASGLDPVDWISVPKARKAEAATAAAVEQGAEAVIVCGGDGTVRAAAGALLNTGVALAVVPTGTANSFARGMDLPTDPADVVALIRSGGRALLDTGNCNGRTFCVMAGTGFDAAMIDAVDTAGKARLGVLSYFHAAVVAAGRWKAFPAAVTVDGTPFFDGPATCVLVGNIGTLAGGIDAFPDASPTDGLLDVGVVTAEGLLEWASVLISVGRRRHEESVHARLTRGARIDVRLTGEHPFQLDGGTKGTASELRFEISPQSLTVCVPG